MKTIQTTPRKVETEVWISDNSVAYIVKTHGKKRNRIILGIFRKPETLPLYTVKPFGLPMEEEKIRVYKYIQSARRYVQKHLN